MRRLAQAGLALAFACVAGCATSPAQQGRAPALVVLVALDGFPQRQLVDYRDQFVEDGFNRFLVRGAWFANAHHGHAFTVTAAGHAVMLTGAYPYRHGIIGNTWRDPATHEVVYCVEDPAHQLIGHKTTKHDGTSPKNLLVETVGDVMRREDSRSRVISASVLERGAILTAGHRGTAYMYQAQTGRFASSTYYMKQHPEWVERFNAARPADRYFKAPWRPLLDDAAYARSLPDAQSWYRPGGQLPKIIGEGLEAAGPRFYGDLRATPFIDDLVIEFSLAAVAAEQLGADTAPDLLVVSLKGHDFINHAWSAESRLSHDHVLRLDRGLQRLFRSLDATVGGGRYLAVLAADHGFTPAPEVSRAKGLDAQRVSAGTITAKLDAELALRFGPGRWVVGTSADTIVLDRSHARERKVDYPALLEEARRLLLAQPGVAAAYTRPELESGSRAGSPFFEPMRRSWNRERSGDLQWAIRRYWMVGGSQGATHGSPNPEDTHIPIAFYGPGWIEPGRHDERIESVDIAPTIAKLLGIPAPSASEGRVLPVLARR